MSLLYKHLYTFRCSLCFICATAPVKTPAGHYRCPRCRGWMRFLFATPIDTEAQQALAQRGLVFDTSIRKEQPQCDVCQNIVRLGAFGGYGVVLKGVGTFCSAKCADEGVRRHEAAMSSPPANVLADASGE